MTDNQIIMGLLALLTIVVAVVAAEIVRLNTTLEPIANSSLVRAATSF
jgi:hypothetical protein